VQSKAPSESTAPEPKSKKDHTLAWKRSTPQYPLQQIRNLDGTHRSSFRKIAKSHRSGSRKRTKRENKSATPLPDSHPYARRRRSGYRANSVISDSTKRKKKLMAGWNEQVPDRPSPSPELLPLTLSAAGTSRRRGAGRAAAIKKGSAPTRLGGGRRRRANHSTQIGGLPSPPPSPACLLGHQA